MKLDCAIIEDLLPLYHEGMLSEQSKQAVDEHIKDCPSCSKELKQLRESPALPQSPALPLNNFSKSIKKRRLLAVLLAGMLLLAAASAVVAYLTDYNYLSYQEGLVEVTRQADTLQVRHKAPGYSLEVNTSRDPERPGLTMIELSLFKPRFELLPVISRQARTPLIHQDGQVSMAQNATTLMLEDPQQAITVYYVKTGELSRLLPGTNSENEGWMNLPRLALAYYLRLVGIAFLVLLVLLLLFFHKERIRLVLLNLLGLPLSYLLAHLLIKGIFTLSYYSLLRDLIWILACAAFLYIAWLVFWRLRREQQEA